jgi:hypothetical protein
MCHWEKFTYQNCPHEVVKRVAYSCCHWPQHVYGDCEYISGRSHIANFVLFNPGTCSPECMYNYVNYRD